MSTPKHPTQATKTSKPSAKEAPAPSDQDVFTMSVAELQSRVTQVLALIAQADALLPGLVILTADDRTHTNGNFRDGEAEALGGVLNVEKKIPGTLSDLAAEDNGVDPKTFEVGLISDRLQRVVILTPIAAAVGSFAQSVSDTRLSLGELTRPVLLAGYEILKPKAKHNTAIATLMAGAIDFYAAIARAAAATRKKNNKK